MKKVVMTIACAAILFGAVEDIRVLQKACDGGNTISCDYIGFLYDNGQGIGQDYKKASELFLKACDMGSPIGCYTLGVLYTNGRGVKQDCKKAIKLYSKACDMGFQPGCDNTELR
ncbi:tetratricopeptide repeat protein [Campylobacter rectus]|uniref:tetratricopeptide repeat protein n=1 Tax=Campylobacter rectus TaxID=203 RepID=UPI0023F187E3|nr:tetratricopeptide repeat protein [Campylobacter rectus]